MIRLPHFCLLTLAGSLSALTAALAAAPPQAEVKTLAIGASAPDFNLPGTDGKNHRLSDYAEAEVLAVVFLCNHCPSAQGAESRVKALIEENAAKSFQLVAISPNDPLSVRLNELGYSLYGDTLAEMKLHAAEYGLTYPYLYDGETQSVSLAYGAIATPHLFLVGEFNEKFNAKPVSLEKIDEEGVKKLAANSTGKLRLVNLWATWCGPCLAEMPQLVEIGRQFETRGFDFITISTDAPEAIEKAATLLKRFHAAMPDLTESSVLEEGRQTNNYLYPGTTDSLAESLDPEWQGALPHTVLLAPGGKVLHRFSGEIDPTELRRVIVKTLGRWYSPE